MKTIICYTALILLVAGCGRPELDRATALDLLKAENRYPRMVDYDIYRSDPAHAKRVLEAGLEEKGLLTVQRTQKLSDAGQPLIHFTDAATPYLLPTPEKDSKLDVQKVKLAEEVFGDVTSVTTADDGKAATVTYATRYANFTPFNELQNSGKGVPEMEPRRSGHQQGCGGVVRELCLPRSGGNGHQIILWRLKCSFMQTVLKEKLWAYIVHHNPDLMFRLQEDYSVTRYLEEKVAGILPMVTELLSENRPLYIVEELCLNAMTEDLKPSRYLYLRSVLEDEFNPDYQRLKESGTLTYEVCNLVEACKGIFDGLGFNSENEEDRLLRYAVIGQVQEYLA